jgi:hypothetical protein
MRRLLAATAAFISLAVLPAAASAAPPTITAGPPQSTNATSVSFSFSSANPSDTFECRTYASIAAGAIPGFTPCTSGTSIPVPVEGYNYFEVRVAGSMNYADVASRQFFVDRTAPDTILANDGLPSFVYLGEGVEFTVNIADTGYGASRFECEVDGAGWRECSYSHGLSVPAEHLGRHTARIRAVDAAGNVDPTPFEHSWEVVGEDYDSDGDGESDLDEEYLPRPSKFVFPRIVKSAKSFDKGYRRALKDCARLRSKKRAKACRAAASTGPSYKLSWNQNTYAYAQIHIRRVGSKKVLGTLYYGDSAGSPSYKWDGRLHTGALKGKRLPAGRYTAMLEVSNLYPKSGFAEAAFVVR